MTIIDIIDAFTYYGFDVILLSAMTAAIVGLIKKFFFKQSNKKLVTFLPFITGTVLYAVYAVLVHMSFEYLAENYASVLEHGFSVGSLTTVIYVLYEQFVREKSVPDLYESIVAHILEGYIENDKLDGAAKQVAQAFEKDSTGTSADHAKEIIKANVPETVTEREILLLVKAVSDALCAVKTK